MPLWMQALVAVGAGKGSASARQSPGARRPAQARGIDKIRAHELGFPPAAATHILGEPTQCIFCGQEAADTTCGIFEARP